MVKYTPASARDVGLMPGSGSSSEEGVATHSSIPTSGSHGQRTLVMLLFTGSQKSWRQLLTKQQEQDTYLTQRKAP